MKQWEALGGLVQFSYSVTTATTTGVEQWNEMNRKKQMQGLNYYINQGFAMIHDELPIEFAQHGYNRTVS
jgi:hypothetical protein